MQLPPSFPVPWLSLIPPSHIFLLSAMWHLPSWMYLLAAAGALMASPHSTPDTFAHLAAPLTDFPSALLGGLGPLLLHLSPPPSLFSACLSPSCLYPLKSLICTSARSGIPICAFKYLWYPEDLNSHNSRLTLTKDGELWGVFFLPVIW